MFLKVARAVFHGIKLFRSVVAKKDNDTAIELYDADESKALSKSALTFGVLGLVFSFAGILTVIGIIFSIIAKRKANAYEKLTGRIKGRTAIGKFLGSAGITVALGFASLCRTLKSLTRFLA